METVDLACFLWEGVALNRHFLDGSENVVNLVDLVVATDLGDLVDLVRSANSVVEVVNLVFEVGSVETQYPAEQVVCQLNQINREILCVVIAFAVVDLATVDFVVANFDYFEKFVDFDETEFVVFAEIAVVVAVLEDNKQLYHIFW